MAVIDYAASVSLTLVNGVATATITPTNPVRSLYATITVGGGSADVTAISVKRSLDGITYGPARAITSGLPVAANGTIDVDIIEESLCKVQFLLTSSAAGTARIIMRGES